MPNDEEVMQRAGSLRAMTGLPQQACTALLPQVEPAVLAAMADRIIDGQPRTSRRYGPYETSPLPTMADPWLFRWTAVQQHPLPEVPGQLCGMSQSQANTWIHRLQAVWNQALAHQEWRPARTADDVAMLLAAKRPEAGPTPARLFMRGPNAPSPARKIPRTSKQMTVASRRGTRSTTAS
jgi:hypothetical protein